MTNKPNSGVYVSRELLERAVKAILNTSQMHPALEDLQALLAQPADQQGEPYRYIVRSTGGGSLSCKPDAAHESLWQDEAHARRYYASGKELHADPKVFWPEEYQIISLYRHAQPATAKVDERNDIDCDAAYRNGVMHGYKLGMEADEAEYQACINGLTRHLCEARAKLNGGEQ